MSDAQNAINAAIGAQVAKVQAGVDKEPRLRDSRGEMTLLSIKSRTGFKGTSIHVRFIIDKCEKVPVTSPKTGQPVDVTPHQPGETVTIISNLKHSAAAGWVKKCICALVGADHEKVSEKDFIEAFTTFAGEKQPGKGLRVKYHTERFVTSNGVEMTSAVLEHLKADPKEIKANRERVEKLGY